MKVLFIESKKEFKEFPRLPKNLPKTLHILYSIQYRKLAENIKRQLKAKKYKILGFEQILGCSKINSRADILLIGSGKFHATQIAAQTEKQVIIYDNGRISKISQKDIQQIKNHQKSKLSKFYNSENIGILFSIKPGQNKLQEHDSIKSKLKSKFKEKHFFSFISETINLNDLENFPIDFWINTSCPGLEFDNKNIFNYEKF